MCPEKPTCAPPRLSDVSPTSPLKHCTIKKQKAFGSMKETVSAIIKEDYLYSSVPDGIYAFGMTHMCSTPSVRH